MRVDRTVPVYPIGVVERLTGLSARKIRYYEAMGLITPSRTPGNQRLYSPADVDRLLEIKRLLAEGLNLHGVRARLHATHGPHPAGGAPPPEHAPPSDVDREYIITQMRAGMKLSSLFPVNNQAALARTVARRSRSPRAPHST